jgi:phosphatidate cytidylyltransferase
MLKTRVITALVLLAILLPVMYSGSTLAFVAIATLFYFAAMWETQRLFEKAAPLGVAFIWSALFVYLTLRPGAFSGQLLFAACILIWCLRLVPALGFGLPPLSGLANALLSSLYGVSIFGCFVAMSILFSHSPLFLFSVMAVVWTADIGAYITGKAIGKHKLAPSISPGKSWEGAIGGWIAVLVIGAVSTTVSGWSDILPVKIVTAYGWIGFVVVMTILSCASVVGDLFESLLKRRAGVKDSSALLPGHGGVLDRIDALIPVLPIAALLEFWWK